MGGAFTILLDHITYGWTSRTPSGSLEKIQLTPEKYNPILLLIKVSIGIAIFILLYRWFKLKNKAANK